MADKVLLIIPTANAGTGTYGRTSLLGGVFALALTLNIGATTAAASSTGSGITTTSPVSKTATESPLPNTGRKRRIKQISSAISIVTDNTSNNEVSSLSSSSDHMSTLLKRVDSFAHLKDGWDGYGGDAPEQATVDNMIAFLSLVPSNYINNLSEYSLMPTSYGTITLEWSTDDDSFVSVEVGHDQIAYFYDIHGEEGTSNGNIQIKSENYSDGIVSALERLYAPNFA